MKDVKNAKNVKINIFRSLNISSILLTTNNTSFNIFINGSAEVRRKKLELFK